MQERRRAVRRQADKELLQRLQELREQVQQLQSAADRRGLASSEETERKRRHQIRHNCKVVIKMMIGHAAGFSDDWSVDTVSIEGRVLDLSAEGAALFTAQPFETGQQLRLMIKLRDGTKVHTNSAVRWVKSIPEKNAYATGVQFVNVDAKDQKRILKFLEELDATAGL